MSASLRAKLQAIAPGAAAPAQAREAGLVVRVDRRAACAELLNLRARGLERMGAWTDFDARKCLFLDTETTGLSGGAGTVAFLVGAGYLQGDRFVTEQFLLRDYCDEPDLLARLAALMQRFESVVTFNGTTFDMPLLKTRFTLCRLDHLWRDLRQLDLLYPARRVWKLRLQSCRLSNLERQVLGVRREGDLPGSEAPERFFRYLQTGEFALLEDVIDHNLQDVITLGVLLARLAALFDEPAAAEDSRDLFSLGRTLERRGEEEARALYARSRDVPEGSYRLFVLLRRAGEWDEARALLEDMVRKNQMGCVPHIELAKYYEHKKRDLRRAIFYTRIALAMCPPAQKEAIRHRLDRLERRQSGGGTDS